MSIAISIIDIVESYAKENGAGKVLSVTVDIGDLSGVDAEGVKFCYEASCAGSLAQGSEIVINKITAAGWCPICETEFRPPHKFVMCPDCESFGCKIICGEQLEVREMKVE